MWLGAADFTIGSPVTGLGSPAISSPDFTSRVQTTIDSVLGAVSDVTRPDAVRVVDTIFFVPEVLIPGPGRRPMEILTKDGSLQLELSVLRLGRFRQRDPAERLPSGLMGIRPMWTTALTLTRFTRFSTAAAKCFRSIEA